MDPSASSASGAPPGKNFPRLQSRKALSARISQIEAKIQSAGGTITHGSSNGSVTNVEISPTNPISSRESDKTSVEAVNKMEDLQSLRQFALDTLAKLDAARVENTQLSLALHAAQSQLADARVRAESAEAQRSEFEQKLSSVLARNLQLQTKVGSLSNSPSFSSYDSLTDPNSKTSDQKNKHEGQEGQTEIPVTQIVTLNIDSTISPSHSQSALAKRTGRALSPSVSNSLNRTALDTRPASQTAASFSPKRAGSTSFPTAPKSPSRKSPRKVFKSLLISTDCFTVEPLPNPNQSSPSPDASSPITTTVSSTSTPPLQINSIDASVHTALSSPTPKKLSKDKKSKSKKHTSTSSSGTLSPRDDEDQQGDKSSDHTSIATTVVPSVPESPGKKVKKLRKTPSAVDDPMATAANSATDGDLHPYDKDDTNNNDSKGNRKTSNPFRRNAKNTSNHSGTANTDHDTHTTSTTSASSTGKRKGSPPKTDTAAQSESEQGTSSNDHHRSTFAVSDTEGLSRGSINSGNTNPRMALWSADKKQPRTRTGIDIISPSLDASTPPIAPVPSKPLSSSNGEISDSQPLTVYEKHSSGDYSSFGSDSVRIKPKKHPRLEKWMKNEKAVSSTSDLGIKASADKGYTTEAHSSSKTYKKHHTMRSGSTSNNISNMGLDRLPGGGRSVDDMATDIESISRRPQNRNAMKGGGIGGAEFDGEFSRDPVDSIPADIVDPSASGLRRPPSRSGSGRTIPRNTVSTENEEGTYNSAEIEAKLNKQRKKSSQKAFKNAALLNSAVEAAAKSGSKLSVPYGVAFGVRRGECEDPCDCKCYNKRNDSYACQTCGHFPAQHYDLGQVSDDEYELLSNSTSQAGSLRGSPDHTLNSKQSAGDLLLRTASSMNDMGTGAGSTTGMDSTLSKESMVNTNNGSVANDPALTAPVLPVETPVIDALWVLDFNDCFFETQLGKGNSSTVFLGTYKTEQVAIKVLRQETHERDLEDFKKEMEIMSSLRSPHIVHFFGATMLPKLCIILEYCSEGTLFHYLQKDTNYVDWRMALRWMTEAAKGINTLHLWKPQIVHRDLKTLNLLLDEKLKIKVCDFGLSRFVTGTEGEQATFFKMRGTFAYFAPEVYQGMPYTAKSDIYSMGIILWEIIRRIIFGTYHRPYAEYKTIKHDFQIITQSSKGLRPTLPLSTPRLLAKLYEDCVAGAPEKRPTCQELLERLEAITQFYEEHADIWDSLVKGGVRIRGQTMHRNMRATAARRIAAMTNVDGTSRSNLIISSLPVHNNSDSTLTNNSANNNSIVTSSNQETTSQSSNIGQLLDRPPLNRSPSRASPGRAELLRTPIASRNLRDDLTRRGVTAELLNMKRTPTPTLTGASASASSSSNDISAPKAGESSNVSSTISTATTNTTTTNAVADSKSFLAQSSESDLNSNAKLAPPSDSSGAEGSSPTITTGLSPRESSIVPVEPPSPKKKRRHHASGSSADDNTSSSPNDSSPPLIRSKSPSSSHKGSIRVSPSPKRKSSPSSPGRATISGSTRRTTNRSQSSKRDSPSKVRSVSTLDTINQEQVAHQDPADEQSTSHQEEQNPDHHTIVDAISSNKSQEE